MDLAGEVEPGQLTNMLNAGHPADGETLGRRFGDSPTDADGRFLLELAVRARRFGVTEHG